MLGERFKLAREASGLSQEDFASKFGISTQDVEAYETEQRTVPADVLSRIAQSICINDAYFYRNEDADLGRLYFLDGSTPLKARYPYLSFVVREQAELWTWLRSLFPSDPVAAYTYSPDLGAISSLDDIEDVAEQVRADWSLQNNPIKNMAQLFEAHGIVVTALAEPCKSEKIAVVQSVRSQIVEKGSERSEQDHLAESFAAQTELSQLDGNFAAQTEQEQFDESAVTRTVLNQLSESVRGRDHGLVTSVGNTPMFVLLPEKTEWHRRFTLASALGYHILNGLLPQGMSVDKACKRFAATFLFPKQKVQELFVSSHGAFESHADAVAKAVFEAHITYGMALEHVLQRCVDLGIFKDDDESIEEKFTKIRDYADGVAAHLDKLDEDMRIDTQSGLFRKLVIEAMQKHFISGSKAAELLNTSEFKLAMELLKQSA